MALTSRPLRAYFRLLKTDVRTRSQGSVASRDGAQIRKVCVPVADEDNQGQAVAELVRTGGGLGGVGAGHLVQQPVRGRTEALLVLLFRRFEP